MRHPESTLSPDLQDRILDLYADLDPREVAQALLEFQRMQRTYLLSEEEADMMPARRTQFQNNMNVLERFLQVIIE